MFSCSSLDRVVISVSVIRTENFTNLPACSPVTPGTHAKQVCNKSEKDVHTSKGDLQYSTVLLSFFPDPKYENVGLQARLLASLMPKLLLPSSLPPWVTKDEALNISRRRDALDAARFFVDKGVGLVVVTRGGRGAFAVCGSSDPQIAGSRLGKTVGGGGGRGGESAELGRRVWEQRCSSVDVSHGRSSQHRLFKLVILINTSGRSEAARLPRRVTAYSGRAPRSRNGQSTIDGTWLSQHCLARDNVSSTAGGP